MATTAASSAKQLVALVTGGASGLGKGTVQRLVKQGFHVGLLDLPQSTGAEVAETFGHERVLFCPVDVSAHEQVKEAVNAIPAKFGRLDVVINCAGVAFAQKLYSVNKAVFMEQERIEKILKVNLHGTVNVIQYSLPHLLANEPDEHGLRGLIINTSSIAAFDGQGGQTLYAATKGAIAAMTLPLARDYAFQGIRAMAIAPGLFETPLMQALPQRAKAYLSKLVLSPSRLGHPDEFAALVEHIIRNPYLNGEVIRIDGGLRMPA